MARRPKKRYARRRKMARYRKGNINLDITPGALASKTGMVADPDTVDDRTLVSSVKAFYSLSDFTPAVNAGPVMVGLAHSDYTLSEIEEFLENVTGWDEGNLQSREIENRKIRKVGVFEAPEDATKSTSLNHGKPVYTKLNWIITEGDTIRFWLYNDGTAALSGATSPNVNIDGHANLWPA